MKESLKNEKDTNITKTLKIAEILEANGVVISKIKLTKYVNGKQKTILLKEIEQEGIDINKIIEKNGLDGNFNFARGINVIRGAYNYKNSYKLTQQQREQAERLGILIVEKKPKERSVVETIKVARILKENGVDLTRIPLSKRINGYVVGTLLKNIQQDGIDMDKIIRENNLNGEMNWGGRVTRLRLLYNETARYYKMTDEERKEIKELGLLETKKEDSKERSIKETIKIIKILSENGVDFKRIKLSRRIKENTKYILLKEIQQEGIDIDKIIEENELDGDFNYGIRIMNLKQVYNGYTQYKLSDEEKKVIEDSGIFHPKEEAIEKTLRIARILNMNGVNLSEVPLSKKINGEQQQTLLKEIKQDGIDIDKIIKENDLDGEMNWGGRVARLRLSSRLTEEEVEEAKRLGLIKELNNKQYEKEKAVCTNEKVKELYKSYSDLYLSKGIKDSDDLENS